MDRALQPERDARYASAIELRADLDPVRAHTTAERVVVADATPRPPGHRWSVLVAALVIVLVPVGLFMKMKPAVLADVKSPSTTAAILAAHAIKLWDAPEKLPSAPGIAWENDSVRLAGGSLASGPKSRDAILRASIRTNADAGAPLIALRKADDSTAQCRLSLEIKIRKLVLRTSNDGDAIAIWPLPRHFGVNEWAQLELRAIGDDFTVLLDGEILGTAHSNALPVAGKALVYAGADGWFRDIVYVPLDGLPEAEIRTLTGSGKP